MDHAKAAPALEMRAMIEHGQRAQRHRRGGGRLSIGQSRSTRLKVDLRAQGLAQARRAGRDRALRRLDQIASDQIGAAGADDLRQRRRHVQRRRCANRFATGNAPAQGRESALPAACEAQRARRTRRFERPATATGGSRQPGRRARGEGLGIEGLGIEGRRRDGAARRGRRAPGAQAEAGENEKRGIARRAPAQGGDRARQDLAGQGDSRSSRAAAPGSRRRARSARARPPGRSESNRRRVRAPQSAAPNSASADSLA